MIRNFIFNFLPFPKAASSVVVLGFKLDYDREPPLRLPGGYIIIFRTIYNKGMCPRMHLHFQQSQIKTKKRKKKHAHSQKTLRIHNWRWHCSCQKESLHERRCATKHKRPIPFVLCFLQSSPLARQGFLYAPGFYSDKTEFVSSASRRWIIILLRSSSFNYFPEKKKKLCGHSSASTPLQQE
jgi:hypothetical protein